MKSFFAKLYLMSFGIFLSINVCACDNVVQRQKSNTTKCFSVKNSLTGGFLIYKITNRDRINIKIALKHGYFTQDIGIRNIIVNQGYIEFKGKNGRLFFYPEKKFCFVVESYNSFVQYNGFNYSPYTGFFLKQYTDYKTRPLHIARFNEGQDVDYWENVLKKDGCSDTIDFACSHNDESTIVFIECIPSADFVGCAEIRLMGNLYNDTGGVEWLLRLIYNPPINK